MSARSRTLWVAVAGVLLAGCSGTSSLPQSPEVVVLEQQAPSYQPNEFNEESLYELLVAELAGQQRDFALAQELTERQAALNNNTELAERATRLAQFLRDVEKVESSAALWQSLQPDNPAPAQILLNTLLGQGRVEPAIEILEQQSELSSETLLIIDTHREKFSDDQANLLLDLLETQNNESTERLDILLVQAHLLRQSGQTERALALINRGLAVESTQADLVFEKAQIIADEGEDLKQALSIVDEAITENTTHRELRALQVRLLLQIDPERVPASVNQALGTTNRDPKLVYYYALLLMENEQYDLSQKLFEELLEADPGVSELYLYLGMIEQERGNAETAISNFQRVTEGDNLMNAMSRALSLMDAETEFDRAKTLIEGAIEKEPDRASDLILIEAQWLMRNEKPQQAIDLLTEQLKRNPDDTELLYSRALLYDSIDPSKMLEDLERALTLAPGNPNIQNALGYSLLEYSDEYERAYQLIAEALEQIPDDPAILDSMAWALHKLDRNEQALPYIEQAFEQFPDPEVGGHLIIILVELDQRDRAQAIYDQLIEDHPESEDLQEALNWLESN